MMRLTSPGALTLRTRLLAVCGLICLSLAFGIRPTAAAAPVKFTPPLTLPQGWPQRLVIPSIHVSATVESLAFTRPQDAKAPYNWGDVAWYDRGPRPGENGRANIFGHLDSTCCPAVFYLLKNLKAGNTVQVSYKKGKPLTFRVLWQATYANNKLPTKFLFGAVHERGLVLMTCAGAFHRDGTGYDHKLIVYARLVLPNGKLG
jgi:hypothetical protein